MMDISTIGISLLSSLGGAAGLTVLLIKKYGTSIIDNQFAKALENYKFKINSKFDRISKIHEKEFEILPAIWKSIIDANSSFATITKMLQTYPDLDRMTEEERKEYYIEIELKKK